VTDAAVENLDDALPAESEPQRAPSLARVLLKWALKLGLLAAIFTYLVKTDRLKASDLQALAQRWDLTLLAMSFYIPCVLLCAFRYQMLLRALHITAHFRDIAAFSMVGMLFDLISPVSNGGDVVKAIYLSRTSSVASGKRGVAIILVSALVDRIVGLFALFTFALIVCALAWPQISGNANLRMSALIIALVCLGGLLGFFVLVSEKLEKSALRKRLMHILPFHEKIERVYASFASLRHHKGVLLIMLVLSIFNHALNCTSVLVLTYGMEFTTVPTASAPGVPATLQLVPFLTVLPLGLFLNTFGFAGGLGGGNVAFEFLFTTVLGLSGGAALALRYQICGILYRLFGIPFLIFYRHKGVNPSLE